MIRGLFQIELPEEMWITSVSRSFPDAQFRLLTGLVIEEGAIELGEAIADDVADVREAIEGHPAVDDYEQLFVGDGHSLAQYTTTQTALYEFLETLAHPPEFPVVVVDGWFEWEVTAPRDQLRAIRAGLEESDLDYEVVSVVQGADSTTLLTDRQRTVLERAVHEGYYEVPRECTLTSLAGSIGIDKSTASTVLRRAEGRIVTWFLAGSESR